MSPLSRPEGNALVSTNSSRGVEAGVSPQPELGGAVEVRDALDVVTWSALVHNVAGDIIRVSGEVPPPPILSVRASVQVSYPDDRSLIVARGRILERTSPMLRIVLVGSCRRMQRRMSPRVLCWQPVSVAVAPDGTRHARNVAAALVDVSNIGCGLRSDAALEVGEPVSFECELGGVRLQLAGRVVRTWHEGTTHGAGVSLTMARNARAVIDRYVVAQHTCTAERVPRFRSV
ncbi:MAG: hypothetical protein JWM72_1703 [Actinomycetia bacterium]|nr:hypothetical protein [Actinomycetes bacterium]